MTVPVVEEKFQHLLLKPEAEQDANASSIRSQVIITEVKGAQIAFPSLWVDEVLFLPRQHILKLPFYKSPVVGLIPHQGELILLMECPNVTSTNESQKGQQENIRAVVLSSQVGPLGGSAVLIDKIIGTISQADLDTQTTLQLFEPEKTSLESFQPYRWA